MNQVESTTSSSLLIIDNQRGLKDPSHWGPVRSNPNYERNITHLVTTCRDAGLYIIHVKHISTDSDSMLHPSAPAPLNHPLGGLGIDFDANTMPLQGEAIIEKSVNSAFIGTDLEVLLRTRRIRTLYICGLTTDHCVSTTTRMASNLHVCDTEMPSLAGKHGTVIEPGRIVLVEDATACFQKPTTLGGKWDAETVHAVHVESLQEFAEVATTAAVIQKLQTSKR